MHTSDRPLIPGFWKNGFPVSRERDEPRPRGERDMRGVRCANGYYVREDGSRRDFRLWLNAAGRLVAVGDPQPRNAERATHLLNLIRGETA